MGAFYRVLPGVVKLFGEPSCRGGSAGYNHQSTLADLNRQAASDEKAKTGDGAVGEPGMPLRRVFYLR